MDDINLKKAFEETYPADSTYWASSMDPRVQREQLQGVQGNRASINISPTLNNIAIQEKKEKDDSDFEQFAAAMDEAQQLFLEASQTAQFALNDLGNTLDTLQADLNQLRDDFAKNTVTLSDGTQVYYNTGTASFERQDAQGDWFVLDDDAQAEATQKAKAHGGIASATQGKQALDEQQAALDHGFFYIITQHDRLEEIDQAVNDGSINYDEGAKQKEQIAQEVDAYKHDLEKDGLELPQELAPAEIKEQNDTQASFQRQDPEWGNQTPTPEIEAMFSNTKDPSTDTINPPFSSPTR